MNQEKIYIQEVTISGFWDRYSIRFQLNPDVNIFDGLNGTGKTTLLKMIAGTLMPNSKLFIPQKSSTVVSLSLSNGKIIDSRAPIYPSDEIPFYPSDEIPLVNWISTFDIPIAAKNRIKKENSPLDWQLECLLYQRDKATYSFTDYRLDATNIYVGGDVENVSVRINKFFSLINEFFEYTNKDIFIDKKNRIFFKLNDRYFEHDDLSSGEKQLLIILFTVFLQKEMPAILFMDEPEISLHTRWQRKLIDTLLQLNPNLQLILTTHSPSMYGEGWMDKIIRMRDVLPLKP